VDLILVAAHQLALNPSVATRLLQQEVAGQPVGLVVQRLLDLLVPE
jgi:hypothetical protein